MTTDLRSLNEQLKREWCDSFSVQLLSDGSLTVVTPFLFGDGDSYPMIIQRRREGWTLSDRGIVASHLQLAELDVTEARAQQIVRFASSHGCAFEGGELRLTLEEPPSVEDVADFIELVAQVTSLPLLGVQEREEQFRTKARERILSWLPDARIARPNWHPQRPRGELFPADLMVPTADDSPVVAFFAGSTQKADRSMTAVVMYRRWELQFKPLLAHNGTLTSDTIYRAQVTFDNDDAVVRVIEEAAETGYLPLKRTLSQLGVPVA